MLKALRATSYCSTGCKCVWSVYSCFAAWGAHHSELDWNRFFFILRRMGKLELKAISYTVGFVSRKRPFLTEAQIELSYTVEKGLFRLNFFRLRILTGGSSRKTQSKKFHVFFEPIASFIPPPNTHPHGHTATYPYQVPHCSIIQGADAGLAITAVASRSKSAWHIPSSARQ